ncbi:DEKNAAC101752 [Brettanomyces naardenensis]|uniref:NADH:ubiquinone reductase (non-electrogenic) n=1 Tax=Brettanomyces naardenensis TaxID=13370 RepID=A0A448YIS8_BRENA|nr:DEKNAAC101752 [Brettanomyces naardenensis]
MLARLPLRTVAMRSLLMRTPIVGLGSVSHGFSASIATRSISYTHASFAEAPKSSVPPSTATPNTPPVPKAKKGPKYGWFNLIFKASVFSVVGFWGWLTWRVYKETNPGEQLPQSPLKENGNKRKNIVILGSGWGAISYLSKLDTTQYNVTIVSPRNYFLFTPLLPSVPSGTIDSRSICDPVRTIARATPGEVRYMEAQAIDIDPEARCIQLEHNSERFSVGDAFINDNEPIRATIDYDYLIYAVGATVNTFGIPGIPENASFLKESNDATAIRQKLFNSIEAARLLPKDSSERKRLMNFVVCGGGPTGVELAAEIQDYIDQDLCKFIPGIEKEMKVTLIEALPNVLASFHPRLIEYTKSIFKEQGLDLLANTRVQSVDKRNVYATLKKSDGTTEDVVVPYGTLVWAGGNTQRPITKRLASKILEQRTARRGLLVDDYLKLDGDDHIFALGDCTFTTNPPTAQVAHQQGHFLAEYFNKLAKLDDLEYSLSKDTDQSQKYDSKIERVKQSMLPFKYRHQGSLAYIGTERAVADLSWGSWSTVALGGSLTFLFWRTAYVSMMLGMRNKILVMTDWLKVAIFGRDCSKES